MVCYDCLTKNEEKLETKETESKNDIYELF